MTREDEIAAVLDGLDEAMFLAERTREGRVVAEAGRVEPGDVHHLPEVEERLAEEGWEWVVSVAGYVVYEYDEE